MSQQAEDPFALPKFKDQVLQSFDKAQPLTLTVIILSPTKKQQQQQQNYTGMTSLNAEIGIGLFYKKIFHNIPIYICSVATSPSVKYE